MRKLLQMAIFIMFGVLFPSARELALGQSLSGLEQGIKPYGSYEGGDIDSVSMVNGSLTLNIPLLSYPQRGGNLHLGFRLVYLNPWLEPWANGCNANTHVCANTGYNLVYSINPAACGNGGPGTCGGPAMGVAADSGLSLNAVLSSTCCPQNVQYYTLTEADNAVHVLGPIGSSTTSGPWRSVDATGFLLSAPMNTTGLGNGTARDRRGNTYTFAPGALTKIEDSNGNFITPAASGSGSWTDTMGRLIPNPPSSGSTADLSHCPSSASTAALWSPPGPNGGTSQFKFCWGTVNISFNVGGNTPTSTTAAELVGIVLPNLTAWTFAYDNYGELATITFPTGGTISYTYQSINGPCVAPDLPHFSAHRIIRHQNLLNS